MKWRPVRRRRQVNRAALENARRHLRKSQADAPAVAQVAADLRREYRRNSFAARVDASLRGRT